MRVPCCVTMATKTLKGSTAMHEANTPLNQDKVAVCCCLLQAKGRQLFAFDKRWLESRQLHSYLPRNAD